MSGGDAPDGGADAGHNLSVSRHIAAPPDIVWTIMTERLAEWWCPRPWRTEIVALDWRPGGRSAMVLRGPEGEAHVLEGVVLEFTPNRRFVFTDAFGEGWVPRGPFMTGIFEVEPEGEGTRYTATARHWDVASCHRHEEMGFYDGWNAVAEQLAELAEGRSAQR